MVGVDDDHGCVLPLGHKGPHEFIACDDTRWLWETDFECDCEECMKADGDSCILYWSKPAARAKLPALTQGKVPEVDPRQISLF
jgi:hypothetical protein